MFRDQSSNVIRKAKAAESRKVNDTALESQQSNDSSRAATPCVTRSECEKGLNLAQSKLEPGFSILPTLDERATCYFAYHYLVGIHAPSAKLLDNLLLLHQTNSLDDNLLAAVNAVAYASYAHHTRSNELSELSRYQYARSVRITNSALRSDLEASKDST